MAKHRNKIFSYLNVPAGNFIVKNILDDILAHVLNDDYAIVTKIIDDVLVKVDKEIARKKHSGYRVSLKQKNE